MLFCIDEVILRTLPVFSTVLKILYFVVSTFICLSVFSEPCHKSCGVYLRVILKKLLYREDLTRVVISYEIY